MKDHCRGTEVTTAPQPDEAPGGQVIIDGWVSAMRLGDREASRYECTQNSGYMYHLPVDVVNSYTVKWMCSGTVPQGLVPFGDRMSDVDGTRLDWVLVPRM